MLVFKIKYGRLSIHVLCVCHSLEINWQKNNSEQTVTKSVWGIRYKRFQQTDEPSANGETAPCGVVQWWPGD